MLLPDPRRRGEVHFFIAKSMPYGMRMTLSLLLVFSGLAVQVVGEGASVVFGLVVVFAGVLLLLTKGFENKPKLKRSKQDWRPARREEVQRILKVDEEQKKWDVDAVDITNSCGCLVLLGSLLVSGALFFVLLSMHHGDPFARPVRLVLNVPIILLPFWFTGSRTILKKDKLLIKAKMLLKVEAAFEMSAPEPGEEFQYQIQTKKAQKGEGEVPQDVKALVMFRDGPPEFLGLQMQLSINNVQGKDYPYFYCVLVARPEFGGLPVTGERTEAPKGLLASLFGSAMQTPTIIVEHEKETDVDVAVIRQRTSKNTGYHTDEAAAQRIFRFALNEARKLLKARG